MDQYLKKFTDYLKSNSILEEEEIIKLAEQINKFELDSAYSTSQYEKNQIDFETKILFSLADYFKGLTPDHCYDLAQRIYNQWQFSEDEFYFNKLKSLFSIMQSKLNLKKLKALNLWKLAIKERDIEEERIKLRTYLENLMKENEILDNEKSMLEDKARNRNIRTEPLSERRTPGVTIKNSKEAAELQTYASTRTNDSKFREKDLFSRLHDEASTKNEIRLLNEELRGHKELELCTFQPEIRSPQHSSNKENEEVFSRLTKNIKPQKELLYLAQKEKAETELCTFHPDLSPRRNTSQEHLNKEHIFKRLHQDAEIKKQIQQTQELLKQEKEMIGCTFNPKLNTSQRTRGRSMSNSLHTQSLCERLHSTYEAKKRSIYKKTLENQQKQMKDCTFQPKLVAKSNIARTDLHIPVGDRLYQRHQQKAKIIQQKKQELRDEQKKMSRFTALRQRRVLSNLSSDRGGVNSQNDSQISMSIEQQQNAFERLYKQGEVNHKKKQQLQKKWLKETGVSFTPRTNLSRNSENKEGFLSRNEKFMKEKNAKLVYQVPTELKGCTFAPKVHHDYLRPSSSATNIGDRLYKFHTEYETKKEFKRQIKDPNLTFTPKLARKTEEWIKEKSGQTYSNMISEQRKHHFESDSHEVIETEGRTDRNVMEDELKNKIEHYYTAYSQPNERERNMLPSSASLRAKPRIYSPKKHKDTHLHNPRNPHSNDNQEDNQILHNYGSNQPHIDSARAYSSKNNTQNTQQTIHQP